MRQSEEIHQVGDSQYRWENKKRHNVWAQARFGHDTRAEFFSPIKTEVFGGCWCREGFWIDGMCPTHIYEPAVR